MTTRQYWTTWALVLGCSGALQLPATFSTSIAGQPGTSAAATRAKDLEARNLARLTAGARLEVQAPGKPALAEDAVASNALLRDDDPLGYELAGGSTSVLVSLPKVEVLNRFNFLNLTASGKVSIAVSSSKLPVDSPRWRAIQTEEFSGDNGVVTCDLGSVEAKYVRISFAVPAEGRIDTFGLYGQRTLGDTFNARGLATKGAASEARYVAFNYAVDSPHAGVIMISPGEDIDQAQQMADGDVGTSYSFKASDPAPMAVIDLGETRTLTRVGASFKAGPGRLAIYLVPDPERRNGSAAAGKAPGKKPALRKIEDVVSTDFPGDLAPVLAVDTGTQPGLNRVGANVDGQSGRYLVMMFHPTGPMPTAGAAADFKDFKDSNESTDFKDVDGGNGTHSASDAPAGNQPLQVAEITGYGTIPPGTSLSNTSPLVPPTVPGAPGGGGGTTAPSGPGAPPIAPPASGTVTP
jgi:hypothetical protein